MTTFNQEALDHIEELLKTISWLGGDAYEMEATADTRNEAQAFLNKHRPAKKEKKLFKKSKSLTSTP
jgi:hypothetical protein